MGRESNEENYATELAAWLAKVNAPTQLIYAETNYNDSHWKEMPVGVVDGWESLGFVGMDGSVWMRYAFELPAEWKGKNLVLNLGRIMEDIT